MSDGTFFCEFTPIGVSGPVFNQVDLMNSRVNSLLATTLSTANQLATYTVSNLSFNIDPTPIQDYTIHTVDETVTFDPVTFTDPGTVPTLGPANAPIPPGPGASPDPPPDAPQPVIPLTPTAYSPIFGTVPTPHFPTTPVYGDLTGGIPFPDLLPITLPAPPNVDFGIPFTALPPVFTAIAPDPHDFNYVAAAYDPLLVTEIKTTIQAMLAGTTGLPRVVEDALWARQAEREAETAAAATQDAFHEMSSRGFTLPNGMLQSKLMQTRQASQSATNSLGRDVMIQVHNVLVDQLKFGVAQGISLENTWIGLFNDIENRRLQAAQVAINISISVYNALVAQYQAEGTIYRVEADVYATRIQAELAKLQGYSEELKAQQLIGELNQQSIAVYSARLSAIETNVHLYVAEIQAYTDLTATEKLKLDYFKTTIDIEVQKLAASQQELQIYIGELQGQSTIQQMYATRAQTYLGNVSAWKTKYEAQIDQQRGAIAAIEADTARYVGEIQGISALANYQLAKGRAIIEGNTAKVQKYTADATVVNAYNEAIGEKIRALNAANAQNTELALKNGEINAQNGLAVAQLLEQKLHAALQVLAQMTASFASSVNMNASVSDSSQYSTACNYITSQSFSSS